MKYRSVDVIIDENFSVESLQVSSKDIILRDWLQYPNNSIEHKRVYEKLLNNIDKIPIDKLESLMDS